MGRGKYEKTHQTLIPTHYQQVMRSSPISWPKEVKTINGPNVGQFWDSLQQHENPIT